MIMVFAGIAIGVFLIDIVLKHSIEERFLPNEERPVLGGEILIRRVHNKGACLNMFQAHPDKVLYSSLFLGVMTLIYDAVLLWKKGHFFRKTGMMLFTGGAFSNIYDRIMRGYVVDYIGFKTRWNKLTRITYNIGDFFIFAGAFLTCLSEIKAAKKKH